MALPLKREFSAGGVVFRRINGQVLWLVQERAGHGYWQLPKGHIEKGESSQQAAVREVKEESGITVRIITKLSAIKYFYVIENERRFKQVQWYLMEYVAGSTADFDPREVSAAKFVPFKEAYKLIEYENEQKILQAADKLVRTGDFQSNLA